MVYEINRQVLPTAPSPTTTHLEVRRSKVSKQSLKLQATRSHRGIHPGAHRQSIHSLNRSDNHVCGFEGAWNLPVCSICRSDKLSSCREDERAALTSCDDAGGRERRCVRCGLIVEVGRFAGSSGMGGMGLDVVVMVDCYCCGGCYGWRERSKVVLKIETLARKSGKRRRDVRRKERGLLGVSGF